MVEAADGFERTWDNEARAAHDAWQNQDDRERQLLNRSHEADMRTRWIAALVRAGLVADQLRDAFYPPGIDLGVSVHEQVAYNTSWQNDTAPGSRLVNEDGLRYVSQLKGWRLLATSMTASATTDPNRVPCQGQGHILVIDGRIAYFNDRSDGRRRKVDFRMLGPGDFRDGPLRPDEDHPYSDLMGDLDRLAEQAQKYTTEGRLFDESEGHHP